MYSPLGFSYNNYSMTSVPNMLPPIDTTIKKLNNMSLNQEYDIPTKINILTLTQYLQHPILTNQLEYMRNLTTKNFALQE